MFTENTHIVSNFNFSVEIEELEPHDKTHRISYVNTHKIYIYLNDTTVDPLKSWLGKCKDADKLNFYVYIYYKYEYVELHRLSLPELMLNEAVFYFTIMYKSFYDTEYSTRIKMCNKIILEKNFSYDVWLDETDTYKILNLNFE